MIGDSIRRGIKHRLFVPIVFGASLIVRILWVLVFQPEPLTDFLWYHESAIDLSQGEGYRIRGHHTAFWPVGYPFFLSLLYKAFGESLWLGKAMNIMLYLFSMGMVHVLVRRFTDSEYIGRLALLFMAFYPNHLAYSSLITSEVLFITLLLGMFILLLNSEKKTLLTIPAGLLCGVACLVKPQALIIPALWYGGCWLLQPGRFWDLCRRGILLYICLFAVTTPWTLRNLKLFGSPVFVSTNGGINLLIGNHPEATGSFHFDEKSELKRELQNMSDEVARSAKASALAKEYIVENTGEVMRRLPKKLYYMYYKDVEGLYWNRMGTEDKHPSLQGVLKGFTGLAQAAYLLLIGSMLFSLRFWLRVDGEARKFIMFFGLNGLYFTALALVFFGSTRFHFPLIPFAIMVAAPCWAITIEKLSTPDRENVAS